MTIQVSDLVLFSRSSFADQIRKKKSLKRRHSSYSDALKMCMLYLCLLTRRQQAHWKWKTAPASQHSSEGFWSGQHIYLSCSCGKNFGHPSFQRGIPPMIRCHSNASTDMHTNHQKWIERRWKEGSPTSVQWKPSFWHLDPTNRQLLLFVEDPTTTTPTFEALRSL